MLAFLLFVSFLRLVSAFPHMRQGVSGYSAARSLSSVNATAHQLSRRGAAPYSDKFPYAGSRNGGFATRPGGFLVPDPSDPDHQFQAPKAGDIRGPCPGTNLMANYGFVSRDGRVTYNELISASQNVFHIGWDLAQFLTIVEFLQNGDFSKPDGGHITIGRPDPAWANGNGFNGHGMFEQDTSMSRADKGITGNAITFSSTSFKQTADTCREVTGGLWNLQCMQVERKRKFDYSVANNPTFAFGPLQLIQYGAATFPYEIYPSLGIEGSPDETLQHSLFGAVPQADGSYTSEPEHLPAEWRSRRKPFTFMLGAQQIAEMYLANPVLFGGNAGKVNSYNALNNTFITNGKLNDQSVNGVACLLVNAVLTNSFGVSDGGGGLLGPLLDPAKQVLAKSKLAPLLGTIGIPGCNLGSLLQ